MIILLWLYPSHLLIAIECIFLQWSLVRYSNIVRMLLPAQFTFLARWVSVVVSLPQCQGGYVWFPPSKEKFTYLFFVSIVQNRKLKISQRKLISRNGINYDFLFHCGFHMQQLLIYAGQNSFKRSVHRVLKVDEPVVT